MEEQILKKVNIILMHINNLKEIFKSNPDYPYVDPPIYSQVDNIIAEINELKIEGIPPLARVETYLSADKEKYANREDVIGKLYEIEGYLKPLKQIDKKFLKAQESIVLVKQICSRFHSVARQLRDRREGRPTLDVQDEYDVQYLIHALLKIYFDDIRPEEWTPSYADGASRMDFLLKNEKIVIETKKTRDNLTDREIGTELIEDIARYKEHPDCELLFCFVYDPEGRIKNPRGLESDLSNEDKRIKTIVSVFPRD